MRISKQESGGSYVSGGRGEYEIADDVPNGLRVTQLFNHTIHLRLGKQLINTGVQLKNAEGKRRLRRDPGTDRMVQFQVTSALMMPKPIRELARLTGGQPVLQTNRYVVKHINLENIVIIDASTVEADVASIDCGNGSYEADQTDVSQRMASVETLWNRRDLFPDDIAELLLSHKNYVQSGSSLPRGTEKVVQSIQGKMADYATDLNVAYAPNTDPVPAMLEVLGLVVQETPTIIDQIEPEDVELRRREIQRWRQYVSRRGGETLKFKRKIREVYDFRCVMCGSRFPPTELNKNPGVDAAHILPWASFDLDEPRNGLALCKIHHWAFDEHLLTITYQDGNYYVELAEEATQTLYLPFFSVDVLREVVGRIPADRLPVNVSDRPHPTILARLNGETP